MSALIRELDRRTTHGLEVTLRWDAATNRVFVSVVEDHDGASFGFEVAAADASDGFHHPYAYACRGLGHAPVAA